MNFVCTSLDWGKRGETCWILRRDVFKLPCPDGVDNPSRAKLDDASHGVKAASNQKAKRRAILGERL